jgi:hypothetical protein
MADSTGRSVRRYRGGVATTQRPRAVTPGAGAPTARRPLFKHPWRIAIVVVGLLAVANLGILLLNKADTSRQGRNFPSAIDDLTPEPGEIIRPQDTVVADLRAGLTGVLVLSGPGFREEIPEDQLERVAPLGQVSFRPGPDQDIRQFAPGNWSAVVLFWKEGKPRPAHPNAFGWSFRVSA